MAKALSQESIQLLKKELAKVKGVPLSNCIFTLSKKGNVVCKYNGSENKHCVSIKPRTYCIYIQSFEKSYMNICTNWSEQEFVKSAKSLVGGNITSPF